MTHSLIIILLSIALAPVQKVAAYLDPGSGSFIIQLLIGALVGGAVALRAYWSRIRAYFSKNSGDDLAVSINDQPPQGESIDDAA